MAKRPFLAGCFTGFVLCVFVLCAGTIGAAYLFKDQIIALRSQQLKAPALTTGVMLDYAWPLKTADGAPLDLGQFRDQLLVLAFWSPDCMHCLAQLPALNGLHEQVQAEGVALISVALGDREKLPGVLAEHDVYFPVCLSEGPVPEVFASTTAPYTVIVGPEGAIRYLQKGAARWDAPETIALIRALKPVPESAE